MRKKQVPSKIEKIHHRVKYLGKKRKFRKCWGSNRKIWKNVKRQKQEKGTFKREKLPGRFMTKKLFGWTDKRYDKKY